MHRHPEGRWQPSDRFFWSAHSDEHGGGLLCSDLPERPERDIRRKVGGVVRVTPLTQTDPVQPNPNQSELMTPNASHWLGLDAATHWQTTGPKLTQGCTHAKSLASGFQHTSLCSLIYFFFLFFPNDLLLICNRTCYSSGFRYALCNVSVRVCLYENK